MKQLLIAITGPSDIGKGIILDKLLQTSNEFERVVSHTDRPKRDNEISGQEYHFVTEEEFTQMIDEERFVEWQMVPTNGFRYGKTKEELDKSMDGNPAKVVFTRINVINLPVFKRHYPYAKSIFIDMETNSLIDFLKNQAHIESEEEFERRYKFATEERRRRHLADHTVTRKEKEDEIIQEILNFINRLRG